MKRDAGPWLHWLLGPGSPSRGCGRARPGAVSPVSRHWRPRSSIRLRSRLRSTMAAMACLSTASVVASRITASTSSTTATTQSRLTAQFTTRRPRSVALRAGNSSGVEPDLEEDFRNIHQTLGEDNEDNFPYGKADGAHSWHGGDDGTWWEGVKEVFETSGGPVGAQGAISWLFIPGLIAGFLFNVNPDYLYIYTVLFIFAFIGMEMAKPSKPSHFEPDMYKLKK